MKYLFFFLFLLVLTIVQAQKVPDNWFNLSYKQSGIRGVGSDRTYEELTKGRKADTVIVAVIDGGVDYMHEDLKAVMWVNREEIAGNGIDDDRNGYVDDIHGWNFLGNKNGQNIEFDQLELTRLLKPLIAKYKGKTEADVAAEDRAEYISYLKMKANFDKQTKEMTTALEYLTDFNRLLTGMKSEIKEQRKVDTVMFADLQAYKPSEKYAAFYADLKKNGVQSQDAWSSFQTGNARNYQQVYNIVNYNLNLDYDSRSIVDDNYSDFSERYYGNADVKGPEASHGTHVAGIIAAVRDNGIGIKGVCGAVKIMAIRCVPNGDERDKDVANSIRYAVDNGAQIINMSFGKAYSYNKTIVDEAVQYAQSKGVLLVHAAGNDNKDTDVENNFPNSRYVTGTAADNWIEVGALSWKTGKESVATFSNYGHKNVDVFAPGVKLLSCKDNGGYIAKSGTSMAAPACAGVAAVLKSYFPQLTPQQLKTIIEQSVDYSLANKRVILPGKQGKKFFNKVKFKKLSKTGGCVDLYAAFQLAEKMTAGK
jgi:subtilisin family serine protease